MADAKRDANNITAILGLSNADGATPLSPYVDSTTNRLLVAATVSADPASSTATLSNVSDTATSTTLLAANTSRLGASIHNDSTAILYVKFGTTASTSSFTVKMAAGDYYEVPFRYTGRIDGIWASDAAGAARMTELT